MNAAATYDTLDDQTKSFFDAIEKLKAVSLLPKNVFFVYYYVLRLLLKCGAVRKSFIRMINNCEQTNCEKRQACVSRFCGISKNIRDDLIYIDSRLRGNTIFKPLSRFTQNSIIEWDDFVVDCEISSDEEIHSLIEKIADAA